PESEGVDSSVVLPIDRTSPTVEVPPEIMDQFQSMLDQAARLNVREEYGAALNVIRSALASNPPDPLGPRFQALELRVKDKLLRRSHLDAFVRFRAPRYTIGDVIEGEILLMNISEESIYIPARVKMAVPKPGGGVSVEGAPEDSELSESQAMVRSEMTYREFIPTNTLVTNRKTQNFRLPSDIRLEPGQFHRIPVTMNTNDINAGGTMYRTYTLRCTLHAAEIRVGNEVFHGKVEYRVGSAGVFPRNAEHLQAEPLKRMKQALAKNSPPHLALAAAYLSDAKMDARDEAFKFLELALKREDILPESIDGILMSLVIMSGSNETKNKEDWQTWLKDREWTKKKP
ncbi:MAG: hypothetical protein ACI97A_004192, partial [Planctomycetota bacterium]